MDTLFVVAAVLLALITIGGGLYIFRAERAVRRKNRQTQQPWKFESEEGKRDKPR